MTTIVMTMMTTTNTMTTMTMTTMMTTTTTTTLMTTTTAGNQAGVAAGEQAGRTSSKAKAASVLKLKNGDDNGVILDGSLLEDAVAGIGVGVMNGDSPTMTTMMLVVIIRQVVVLSANA